MVIRAGCQFTLTPIPIGVVYIKSIKVQFKTSAKLLWPLPTSRTTFIWVKYELCNNNTRSLHSSSHTFVLSVYVYRMSTSTLKANFYTFRKWTEYVENRWHINNPIATPQLHLLVVNKHSNYPRSVRFYILRPSKAMWYSLVCVALI